MASGQAVTYNRPQATQTATYNSRGATVPPVSTASAGSQAGTVVVKVSGNTTSRCTTPAVVATSTRVTTTGTTGNTNRVGTPAVVATNSVKTTTTGTTATRITTPAVTVSTTRVTTAGSIGNTNRVGTPAVVATGSFQMIDFGNSSLHIMTSAVLAGNMSGWNTGDKWIMPSPTMYWEGREIDFSKINSMLTPFPTAPTTVETVQVQEEKKNEQLHKWLDGAGLIPYIGDWVDLVNGGIYAFEGDWLNALISASAFFFDGATAGRLATDVTQEMVERGVREGAEEVAERAGRETAEDITEAAIKGGTSTFKYKEIKTFTADETNQWFIDNVKPDYKPPYKPGTIVKEIELTENTTFVRVYDNTPDGSGMYGSWLMKAEDIEGLTPLEIQNKFALPNTPKYVCDVELEAGTHIRVGEVNPLEGWGSGGGTQYDLIGQRIGDFKNERLLEGN